VPAAHKAARTSPLVREFTNSPWTGGDEVAAVVAGYVEDDLFGFEASLVLKAISDRQLNAPEPSVFRQWPWLDEVAAGRSRRSVIPPPEPANAYAVPIFAAIDRLAKPENDRHRQLLAIQLTRVALAMPHRNQDELVARVMVLPQPLKAKRELAAAMALDGQILDSKLILQAIDDWLDEAKKNEWQSRQNTWEIERWLELLPFTDRPESVLDGLTKVKAFYGSQWAQRWERVLCAVAAVPGPQGEMLLAALAKSHKDIANGFEWMRSILARNNIEASLLYVDLYMDGTLARGPHATDASHAARVLAEYVEKFPMLKAELKKRYEAASTETDRAIFEHLFGEIGESDDLIAMVKKYAANGRQYDGLMSEAVRSVTIRHEPVNEGANNFYIHPASVGLIRKQLFDMRGGTGQEAALASRCLVEIDELRDEYGIAGNDPRHPDVMSGIPWPTEAGKQG
jgi:NACHT C-terminal Alpha/Beta 2